jgi:choline dehydrogenase-like flavoprotein
VPGFAVRRPDNVYPLHYHGEQIPLRESRVTLADARDAVGMPRLAIDLRFADADVDGIVRAHAAWDAYLRRHGVGRLEYLADDVPAAVRGWLGGGFHQIGTTRMSARPEDGVLDTDLAVHGHPALHVVSSSAFPTSGQANSTFMVVAFALRLADHLRRVL